MLHVMCNYVLLFKRQFYSEIKGLVQGWLPEQCGRVWFPDVWNKDSHRDTPIVDD